MTDAATPEVTTTDLPVDPNAAAPQTPAAAEPSASETPATQTVTVDGVAHTIPTDLSTVADEDERASFQALLDIAKEQKKPDGEAATPSPEATPAAPAEGTPKAGGEPAKPEKLVPVSALISERNRAQQAIDQANYYKGLAEGRAAAPGTTTPAATPAAPEPTPTDKIAGLHAQIDALAVQFDNGDITMADYKKQERILEGQITDIRNQELLAKVPATQAAPRGDDLYLEEKSAELETQHPYAVLLFPESLPTDASEREILVSRQNLVRSEAIAQLKRENPGVALTDDNPRAVLMLRQTMAQIADTYGKTWFPNAQVAPKVTPAAQPPAKPGAQPSPAAQNRLNKLITAAQQPPDTTAIGVTGNPTGQLTEEQVLAMSEDERAKLTPQQLAQFGVMI